jgi:hypothetical protein
MTDTDTGAAYFDVECRIDQLGTMADWRKQISAELRRVELLFELNLLTESHLDSLAGRVRLFNDAAKALTPKVR